MYVQAAEISGDTRNKISDLLLSACVIKKKRQVYHMSTMSQKQSLITASGKQSTQVYCFAMYPRR